MCVIVFPACMSRAYSAHGGQMKAPGPLELELQTNVSCIWVLEHDPESSTRPASAASPQP